jgi:hypothetical protein
MDERYRKKLPIGLRRSQISPYYCFKRGAMLSPTRCRYLSSAALLILVAGCSASGTQISAITDSDKPILQSPSTPDGLIYASNGHEVDLYRLKGKNQGVIARIAGFTTPEGLAVDKDSNLYVANYGAQNVLKYSPGTKPTLLLTLSAPGTPLGVSVDSKTDDVAVTNVGNFVSGGGGVYFYHSGQTTPYKTVTSKHFNTIRFAAFDSAGNLFLDGATVNYYDVLFGEISAGSHNIKRIEGGFQGSGVVPAGLVVNGNKLYALDSNTGDIFCSYTTSPYNPCGETELHGGANFQMFALLKKDNYIYTSGSPVSKYAFPAGGNPINSLQGAGSGVAIAPAALP